MNTINKEELLNEIKIKLNILENQNPDINLINFNLNIGYLETLIKENKIEKEITQKLINNLKELNIDKLNSNLTKTSLELIN